MSLPKKLAEGTLAKIVDRFRLTETRVDGGPLLTLKSAMMPEPVGALREFRGGPLQKVVTVSLVVPQIGLDSHMIFAFTKADSPIPHFTLDSVRGAEFFAFHLDLIPRADLGAYLPYMNAALFPVTETFQAAQTIEGLTPARLGPRQLALMSPWMLAFRANEAAFQRIETPVDTYLQHWIRLVEGGLPEAATRDVPAHRWAERDRLNRAALFNPETDPVWNQVTRLVGDATSARIRDELKSQS